MYEDFRRDVTEGFEFLGVEFGTQFKWIYLVILLGMTWLIVKTQYLPYTPRSLTEFTQLTTGSNTTYCRAKFPFTRR